jgi:hypothetical protein
VEPVDAVVPAAPQPAPVPVAPVPAGPSDPEPRVSAADDEQLEQAFDHLPATRPVFPNRIRIPERAPDVAGPPPRRGRRLVLLLAAAVLTFALGLALAVAWLSHDSSPQSTPATPTVIQQTTVAANPLVSPTANVTPSVAAQPTVPLGPSGPPPTASNPLAAAQLPSPIAVQPAASQPIARFNPERPAVLRIEPRVRGAAIEVPIGDSRRGTLDVRQAVHGEKPPLLLYPPAEQTDVWYEIVWPPGSGNTAYVHCSAIQLIDSSQRSCSPPEALFQPR